jgi:DNA-directed RNA polymerase specialized sigma24 family protein
MGTLRDPAAERDRLIEHARRSLREHGLPPADAEDLVQDAYVAWCASDAVRDPLNWLFGAIRNLARVRARRQAGLRPSDPLERGCLSLDEPWARG